MNNNILILGIGNTLLTDEGAGIHAMESLQSLCDAADFPLDHYPGITYVDGGTLSFTLATWIEDHEALIVFDAAQLQQAPGTVEAFVGDGMDDFLGRSKHSAHEVGLLDLMDIARLTGHLPEYRALIAIQPEVMTWGMHTSDRVTPALDIAAQHAIDIMDNWYRDKNVEHIAADDLPGKEVADKDVAGDSRTVITPQA